jgi:integrase
LVAYHLGLRYGEIVNLTWDRVDLKGGFITLRAQDTKNKTARKVPLTPELTALFRDLYKVRYLGQDRVFLRNGESIHSIRTAFDKAKGRAGIVNFRFHDTRHCAATNMRRAGVDVTTAMEIVGHKSVQMFRRYNTIDERDLKAAATRINTYLTLAHQEAESATQNSAI